MTGQSTGLLRSSLKLQGSSYSGFAADEFDRLHFIPSIPPLNVTGLDLKRTDQGTMYISGLHYTDSSLGNVANVWNVVPRERTGSLIGMTPAPSFHTRLLEIDPATGGIDVLSTIPGVPVRGLYAGDQVGDRFWFAVSASPHPALVEVRGSTGTTLEGSFGSEFSSLVGIHYDESRCMLLGFFLRAPGLLSMRSIEVLPSGHLSLSGELEALSPAANTDATALDLIGMTHMVSGAEGPVLIVRDPMGLQASAFDVWGRTSYTFGADDVVGVTSKTTLKPRVASVHPTSVGMTGHAVITIVGSDFGLRDSTPTVEIGGVSSSGVSWVSDTVITAVVPASTSRLPTSLLSGVSQEVKVSLLGTVAQSIGEGASSSLGVRYVTSWHSVSPSSASVVGGTMLSISGGRFDAAASYSCNFGGVNTTVGTRVNDYMVKCPSPEWMGAAGEASLSLTASGELVHSDREGTFLFKAGDAVRMAVVERPWYLLGGAIPSTPFAAAVLDVRGNPVLDWSQQVNLTVRSAAVGAGWPPILTRHGVGAIDGVATFSDVSINATGNYSFTFRTPGLADIQIDVPVYVGPASTLEIDMPESVLAGLPVAPQPTVKAVDSGGNTVDVAWSVHAVLDSTGGESMQATDVQFSSGVTTFSDLTLYTSGVFNVRFVTGGINVSKIVTVLPSSPVHIYNSVSMQPGQHPAMQSLRPTPSILVLDVAMNHIRERYWTQATNGTLTPHYLDVEIEASLVTVFSNLSSEVRQQIHLPTSFPSGTGQWEYRLYGVTTIRLITGPNTTSLTCPRDCSGNGTCGGGACECHDGWQGVSCGRPAGSMICRATDCESRLGYYYGDVCHCQATGDTVFSATQVGSAANFSSLQIDRKAEGYVVMFTSPGLTPASTLPFSISSGQVTHLGLISQPYGSSKPLGGYGGVGLVNAPMVEVRDGGGNLVRDDSVLRIVRVGLEDNATGAILTGENSTVAVKGLATFDSVAVDLVGEGYRLVFTCQGLIPTVSDYFSVTYGPPHSITVVVESGGAYGGEAMQQQPRLEVRDVGLNRVMNATVAITASLVTPQGSSASISSGNTVAVSSEGLAAFTDLAVDLVGSGYALEFTSGNMSSVQSDLFDVNQGSAYEIEVLRQPGNATGGLLITQPIVKVYDAGGNWVTDKEQLINVFYVNGSSPFSNTSVAGSGWSAAGFANFTDVAVRPVGTNFSLVFQSANVTNGPLFYSRPFDILVGEPFKFYIVQQPPNSWAGEPFLIQPRVVLSDRGDNTVVLSHAVKAFLNVSEPLNRTLDTAFATSLPLQNYSGATCTLALSDPVLSGTDTIWSDGEGVVRFTNLSVNVAAPGYMLSFVSLSNLVTGATSDAFTIRLSPGQPNIIRVVCTPGNETAASTFAQQPVLQIVDRGGNTRHLASGFPVVKVSLVAMPGVNATLTGSKSSVRHGDLSTFTDLAIDTGVSGLVLKFSSSGYTSGYSQKFSVLPSGAAALSIRSSFTNPSTQQPQTFAEGGEEFELDVFIVDKGGNLALDTRNVEVELWKNVQQVRTFSCKGAQTCKSLINASVPTGARLVSAKASITIQCTDIDNPAEYISGLSIASVPLSEDQFESGPFPGCARSCSNPASVVVDYDIVRNICWSSDQDTACARMIVANTWDQDRQTAWDFFQEVSKEKNEEVPLVMKVTPDVNFYPCDGYFLNAEVSMTLEYSTPIVGSHNGTLSGTTTVAAVDGVAHFTGLSIDLANSRYTIKASADGMVAAYSFPFPVVPGPVASVGVTVQPGNGTGDTALAVQPEVDLFDSVGNRVSRSDEVSVSLVIDDLAGGMAADQNDYLLGTTTVVAVDGRAAFTDLFVGKATDGVAYRLNITSGSSQPAITDRFYVSVGPPYKIGLFVQPGVGYGGSPLTTQPIASPQDLSGNFVGGYQGVVQVAIGKNGGVVGELSGTTQATLVDGQASFNDLSIDRVGEGYTLMFSIDGLADGESASFDIDKGNASRISIVRQPKRSTVNQLLTSPQPAVAITDDGGNIITDWQGNITVAIHQQGRSPHSSIQQQNATLNGTLEGYLYEGIFYWWNLRLDKVGIDIILVFTSEPSFAPALSDPFSVYGGHAKSLSIFSQPSMTKAKVAPPPVLIAAVDANGDVDFDFEGTASVALAEASSPSISLQASQGVTFTAGIASFTDLVVQQTGSLSLNFSAADLSSALTETYEVIDAWAGWWVINWPRSETALGFFMKRVGTAVEAMWRISATDTVTYVSAGAPFAKPGGNCESSVGQVAKNGAGAGSFLMDNCGGDNISITTAMNTAVSPPTSWAKDVEHFVVEEYFPVRLTRHYVAVANSFDGTSYTTDSALYEWRNGNLDEVTPSPFQGTKGAHSWKHFVMGGVHHLVVANHYDDQGNGYGVPSIVYRLQYNSIRNRNVFTPIQSISTAGAASWEAFEIGEDTFLAVANYFNGSHFDINSKIFKLARTNPDVAIPRVESIQSIPTSGARSVKAFDIGGVQYLAYANRWAGNIMVYRWDEAGQKFVHHTTVPSMGVLHIEVFVIEEQTMLAVANTPENMPASASWTRSSVLVYDAATSSFSRLQDLGSGGAFSDVKHFVHDDSHFLAMAKVYDDAASNGSSVVYRWDGTVFVALFDLPSMNAYALDFLSVPCTITASDGDPCGTRESEDIIVAANGLGVSSMVFAMGTANLTLEATHVVMEGDSPADAVVNDTLAPPTKAVLKKLVEDATPGYDRYVSIEAEVFAEVLPPGQARALPRTVAAGGVTTKALGADGTVTFDEVQVIAAGNMSVRVFDEYLSNVTASMSDRFFLSPREAINLRVSDVPMIINSSEAIKVVVYAVDEFENYQPLSGPVLVTATIEGMPDAAVTGNEASLNRGVAVFPAIAVAGIFSQIRFAFNASGFEIATSSRFDVAAPTFVSAGTIGQNIPLLAGGTATSPGTGSVMYVFGGLDPTFGPVNTLWKIDTSTVPFTVTQVQTTRRRNLLSVSGAPSPRYDHAAVAVSMSGVANLFVIGGRNQSMALPGVYRLNLETLSWTDLKIDDAPGRSKHSIVLAVPTTNGAVSTDGTSAIVVFGGKGTNGQALADVRTYRVYGQGVSYGGSPQSAAGGNVPSPRWGALMAWVNGTAYILGGFDASGDLSDEYLYSFKLDYLTATLTYRISWRSKFRPQALVAGSRPPTPLSSTPAVVDNRIYMIAPASAGQTDVKVYVLEPQAGIWQPTLAAGTASGSESIYSSLLVPVAPGKVAIFLSSEGSNTSQALMLSSSPSHKLKVNSSLPSGARAGVALSPTPTVHVQDESGRLVATDDTTVVTAHAFDASGAAVQFGGLAEVKAAKGVARFTTLSINSNGTGIRLRFSSPALFPDSTGAFYVGPGPLYRVMYDRVLRGVTPGAVFAIQPTVRIVDIAGNLVVGDSFSTLRAELERLDGASWVDASSELEGNKQVKAVRGYVSFTDLAISSSTPRDYTFRLLVTRSGISPAVSRGFNFTGPSETNLVFETISKTYLPATNSCFAFVGVDSLTCNLYRPAGYTSVQPVVYGGVPFKNRPKIVFELKDSNGLLLSAYGGVNVTATLVDSTTGVPISGATRGTTEVEASSGSVTFTDLAISKSGNYKLRFDSPGMIELYSITFRVTPGPPDAVHTLRSPEATSLAGTNFVSQPYVVVVDAGGNNVTRIILVTASLTAPEGNGAVLDGNAVIGTAGGNAFFTDLSVDKPGSGFQLEFKVSDGCCGVTRNSTTDPFDVRVGDAYQLDELVGPSGAIGGEPFGTQPVVRVLDAGGNPVNDYNDTVVTAQIGQDNQMFFRIKSSSPTGPGDEIMDVEPFFYNGTQYVIVARYFDGSTYLVNSTLYSWDESSEELVFVQDFPSLGAWDWEHVVSADGNDVYLVVANHFREAFTDEGGIPLGTFQTQSFVFKMFRGELVFALSFDTKGATSVESWVFGGLTFIGVTNSFDDSSRTPESEIFYMVDTSDPDVSVEVQLISFQTLPSSSAQQMALIPLDTKQRFLAIANGFQGTSYVANSSIFRFDSGEFVPWREVKTYAAVGVKNFQVGTRTFVVFAEALTESEDVHDGGQLRIFELAGSVQAPELVLRQSIAGISGIREINHYNLNQAEWIAVATDPIPAVNKQGGLVIMMWNTSLCNGTATCEANFTEYRSELGVGVQSVNYFTVGGSSGYLVYAGMGGIKVAEFKSLAGFSGTTTAVFVSGVATFVDLGITLAQDNYRIRYSAKGLVSADGTLFDVAVGAPHHLKVETFPSGAKGGSAFAVQPVISVLDVGNNVVSNTSLAITASIAGGGGANLLGLWVAQSPSGIASFTDLSIDLKGSSVLEFNTGSLVGATATIAVAEGEPYKVSAASSLSSGTAGVALDQMPMVVKVLDRGGNWLEGENSTVVEAYMETGFKSGGKEFAVVSSFAKTGGVHQAEAFTRRGTSYVVVRTGAVSADNVEVLTWVCRELVHLQTLAVQETWDIAVFESRGSVFLSAAGPSGLTILRFIDEASHFVVINNQSGIEASTVRAYSSVTNETGSDSIHLSIGRSRKAPYSHGIGGWQIYSFDGVGELTLVQNVSEGETIQIEHAQIHGQYGTRDLMVRSFYEDGVTSDKTLDFYLWDVYVHGFVRYDEATVPEVWPNGGSFPSHGSMAAFPVFTAASGGLNRFELLVDTSSTAYGSFAVAIATDDESTTGVLVFAATDSFYGGDYGTGGALSPTILKGGKGMNYVAFRQALQVVMEDLDDDSGVWTSPAVSAAITGSMAKMTYAVLGGEPVLLVPTGGSLEVMSTIGTEARLSGVTSLSAVDGQVTFTDLSIDVPGSYSIAFAIPSSGARIARLGDKTVAAVEHPVAITGGTGFALRFVAANGPIPTVEIVDAGKNLVAGDSSSSVRAIGYDITLTPSLVTVVSGFSTAGAKRTSHFTAGGKVFVAVANQYDGIAYNIDSILYEFVSGTNSATLTQFQQISTRGAYDLTAFDLPVSGGVESYLAVANHYDDDTHYETDSKIYRWSTGDNSFVEEATIPTNGATHIEYFSVEGHHYLAVANFFDGTNHATDSAIYKWTWSGSAWVLGSEPVQLLPTVAAHHIAFFEQDGESYLAVAQQWDEKQSSFSGFSVVYKWDSFLDKFVQLGSIPSQSALHIEPFDMDGDQYLAVANSLNVTTGKPSSQSTVYRMSCDGGEHLFTPVQQIQTEGATRWRYTKNAGMHFIVVAEWVPQSTSKISAYRWDGPDTGFMPYVELDNLGAFDVDVIKDVNGVFFVETRPAESTSVVSRLRSVDTNGDEVAPSSTLRFASNGVVTFDHVNNVALEFFSADGYEGTGSGTYFLP